MRELLILLPLMLAAQFCHSQQRLFSRPTYETPEYWAKQARDDMDRASRVMSRLRNTAKNVILFIGDGMGISTVTAGRILKGQLANSSGEETKLAFDALDHAGLIKTYNVDRQTPDSAATATAFLCGVKTNIYTVGVNQNANYSRCSTYSSKDHDTLSFLKLASDEGRSTGVLTTSTVTGATPAPAYASSVSRSWQDDTDRNSDNSSPDSVDQRRACPDIATQMIDKGINFTVIMGGGRLKFLPKNVTTTNQITGKQINGTRSDGVNLVERWRQLQTQFGRRAAYIETTDELNNIQPDSVDSVLGLMSVSDMEYHVTNIRSKGYKEPSLADMTRKTLQILSKNPKGYAALIEGGRIDTGHHGNRLQKSLYDLVAFDEAIQAAINMTSAEDTLIVVSADHSHVFTIGYYGFRGQPILGKVIDRVEPLRYAKGADGLEHTVGTYGDGPSASNGQSRVNISAQVPEENEDFRYPSLIPRSVESHSAEDVSVLARGPGAHLFHSVHEQSYIAHVIMKSTCLGPYAKSINCPGGPVTIQPPGQFTTTKSAFPAISYPSTGLFSLSFLVAAAAFLGEIGPQISNK